MEAIATPDFKSLLGRKIKMLRLEKGLRQEDLGRLLGYDSLTMISLIESGKKGMGMDKISKAAEVFGVNEAFLLSTKQLNNEQIQMIIDLNRVVDNPESDAYKMVRNMLAATRELFAN
jgi:transcriptional regulator with XRE-family HTH domain